MVYYRHSTKSKNTHMHLPGCRFVIFKVNCAYGWAGIFRKNISIKIKVIFKEGEKNLKTLEVLYDKP